MAQARAIDTRATLAIDTATPYLALGLLGAGHAWTWRREVGRQHAEQLPGAVDELLHTSGLGKGDIGQIVIGCGPGSYTGLRVGASYALGLGRAWNVPVRAVSSLEALIDAGQDGLQAVSLDARKGQVYGALYRVSGGAVSRVQLPAGKYEQESFAEQVLGHPWRKDPVPDPLALARAGQLRGVSGWQLQYL